MNWTGVYTGYKTIQSEDDKTCDRVDEGRSDTVVCAAHGTPGRGAACRPGLTTLHRIISRLVKTFRQATFNRLLFVSTFILNNLWSTQILVQAVQGMR
jgi:hypothetical protein